MAWYKKLNPIKLPHRISSEAGRVVKKATGSDTAAKVAKKAVGWGVGDSTYLGLHAADHISGGIKKALDPGGEEQPEQEGLEIDMSGVEEALAMMAEYQARALEAATKEEQPAEPLKNAQAAYDGAQTDTNRLQLLRRGLMSTFTRYGGGLGGSRQTLGV